MPASAVTMSSNNPFLKGILCFEIAKNTYKAMFAVSSFQSGIT